MGARPEQGGQGTALALANNPAVRPADTYADCNLYPYTDCNFNTPAHGNLYAYADCNAYTHANSDIHAD